MTAECAGVPPAGPQRGGAAARVQAAGAREARGRGEWRGREDGGRPRAEAAAAGERAAPAQPQPGGGAQGDHHRGGHHGGLPPLLGTFLHHQHCQRLLQGEHCLNGNT